MTPTAVRGMVSAVLSGVPGAQAAHVLKARDPEDAPNDLERETVRRSCQALLQVRCSLAVWPVADIQPACASGMGPRRTFSLASLHSHCWHPCIDAEGSCHPCSVSCCLK